MTNLNTEREALLPCPHCGFAAEFCVEPGARYKHGVRCTNISCESKILGTAFANNAFNADLWNRRAQASVPALPVEAIQAAIRALEEDSELSLQCAMIPPISGEVSNKHLQQSKDSDRHAAALRTLLKEGK